MEEDLRSYFLKAGYYVIRGVPFTYEGFDVTDIDLWLYGRLSPLTREITIVDIKNKKTPQAIERIFWVHGLKAAVNATSAVVATTERKNEVKKFGKALGVSVLDGAFLSRISKTREEHRLTEEQFNQKVLDFIKVEPSSLWKVKLRESKILFSRGLSFDSCNLLLNNGKYFAEQVLINNVYRETAFRCLLLICSYIAVVIDYLIKDYSFLEQPERIKSITDGFTFGSKGELGMKQSLNLAYDLVAQNIDDGDSLANQMRSNISYQFAILNTEILGEYFAKTSVAQSLISVAVELESVSKHNGELQRLNVSVQLKSLLYCLLDYWKITRKGFFE